MIKIALISISWFLNNQEEIKIANLAMESYGKQGYSKQGYSKQSYGKNPKNPKTLEPEEEDEEFYGAGYTHPIYLLAPSFGGILPPGELRPLSPSSPTFSK